MPTIIKCTTHTEEEFFDAFCDWCSTYINSFFFYKEILRSSRNKTVFMLPCKKRYCCHDYGSSRRTNETRKQRMRVMKIKNNNQKEIVKEFEGFVKVIKQKSQSVTLETANCPYSFQWKDIVKEYHNYLAVQCLGILHLR